MKSIKGEEIFFNFIEVHYQNNEAKKDLIEKLYRNELDGFVAKKVFSEQEVSQILKEANNISESHFLKAANGKLFPHPHASITDKEEKLNAYIEKNSIFNSMGFSFLKTRLQSFFDHYGGSLKAKIPKVLKDNSEAVYGNLRFFMPNMGGLFVHCGYLFQVEAPMYYEVVEEMKKMGQLSYFLVLQYPEKGGELTIYDMLWPDVQHKDDFENNEYVIDKNGDKLFLDEVKSFSVKPQPGDVLVFKGGPIWHRVEDIIGTKPRITFGGFINFSKDGKEFFFWS